MGKLPQPPLNEEGFDEGVLEILIAWMYERESIRKKKLAGVLPPWTADPFLRDFRWCNVRRLDDRVSQELFEYWYDLEADPNTLLTAATLGRLVNWPVALLEITGGKRFELGHLTVAKERLTDRVDRGDKVFTAAYIVPGVPGMKKVDSVCELAMRISEHDGPILGKSMRETWENLLQFAGIGRFLAGQIVGDLAHLSPGKGWTDPDYWAPVGPGSARGMNRLLGRPKDAPVTQGEFEIQLPKIIRLITEHAPSIVNELNLQALDHQSLLCELDKRVRLGNKEGSMRSRYDSSSVLQGSLL